jgi:crotonobetainyl-CoA:carnitine CoA-transferase CaiB-like acyl-CoA transferase
MSKKNEGMLSPYRVLDLTDEKGLLCGKIFGDLGADVIKIERPGGDPARNIGPFYHDEPDPEKSLFWFAFNTNKRGITLDIEATDGQEIFKRLVKSADFIVESFPPGHMDRLGLGYADLEKLNPGIIMVSITPFGQDGPYRDYKAPDIVAWAMGGQSYLYGDANRPPVRVSYHSQAYLQAGGAAAVGAMMAHQYRNITGEGQHVDISIQEVVARIPEFQAVNWDMLKLLLAKEQRVGNRIERNQMWPCKDGHVIWLYFAGQSADWTRKLTKWMESEGMIDEFFRDFDWESIELTQAPKELIERLEEPMRKFFLAHTREELHRGALKHDVMLFPVDNTADILASSQLAARDFWVEVEHPELGTTITYPGPFAHASELPPRVSRRAPLIGEHNHEIYEKELGISSEELVMLKQAGVI